MVVCRHNFGRVSHTHTLDDQRQALVHTEYVGTHLGLRSPVWRMHRVCGLVLMFASHLSHRPEAFGVLVRVDQGVGQTRARGWKGGSPEIRPEPVSHGSNLDEDSCRLHDLIPELGFRGVKQCRLRRCSSTCDPWGGRCWPNLAPPPASGLRAHLPNPPPACPQ